MQRSETTRIAEVRFGWHEDSLCVLVVPGVSALLEGLEVELRLTRPGREDDPVVLMLLEEHGHVEVSCMQSTHLVGTVEAVWKDVLEASLPLEATVARAAAQMGLVVHIGRDHMTEYVFHSGGLVSLGNGGQ